MANKKADIEKNKKFNKFLRLLTAQRQAINEIKLAIKKAFISLQ